MAGDGDGDVGGLAVAETWVGGERDDALLVGDDGRGNGEVLPEDLAFALAFGDEDFAGGVGDVDDEGGFFAGADAGAFVLAGFDGDDRSFSERDASAEFDFDGGTAAKGEERGGEDSFGNEVLMPGRAHVGVLRWYCWGFDEGGAEFV